MIAIKLTKSNLNMDLAMRSDDPCSFFGCFKCTSDSEALVAPLQGERVGPTNSRIVASASIFLMVYFY